MLDAVITSIILLPICGAFFLSWGIASALYDGFSIKNSLAILIGITLFALCIYLIKEEGERNHESYIKSHPIEIITSTPARIDTTITIRNGVADTTYTYYLIKK